jgi:hypothetical protein
MACLSISDLGYETRSIAEEAFRKQKSVIIYEKLLDVSFVDGRILLEFA